MKPSEIKQIKELIAKAREVECEIVAEMRRIRKERKMGFGVDLMNLETMRRNEEETIRDLEMLIMFEG